MTRSYYDARPSKFEAVGNGSYIYRWDIQEEAAPQQIMAEGEDQPAAESSRTQYSCYEVIVWASVSINKITEAVIRSMWDANYEQKAHQRVQRRQSRRIWRLQVERRGKGEDRLVQGLSRSESRVESPNRRRLRRA